MAYTLTYALDKVLSRRHSRLRGNDVRIVARVQRSVTRGTTFLHTPALLLVTTPTQLLHSAAAKLQLDTGENMQDIALFVHNHWQLTTLLAIVLFILIIIEFLNQKRATKQLSPAQATQLINRSEAVIVDIRSPALFSAGHIIGAIPAPITDLKEKITKLEKFKSQPIVIVCASGIESIRASTVLSTAGFDVRILSGGIRAWTEADMPLVKD